MSEQHFLEWVGKTGARAEWVDGEVIMMAPANIEHQDVCGWLYKLLGLYAERRELGFTCLDVWTRLAEPRPQLRGPDVLFIAKERMNIIVQGKVHGPPDLIMEVVSADSESRDWREKFLDYQGAGVREYWVIDPSSQTIEAHTLVDGAFKRIEEQDTSRISSLIVPGFYVKHGWIWQWPRKSVLDLLPELGIKLA